MTSNYKNILEQYPQLTKVEIALFESIKDISKSTGWMNLDNELLASMLNISVRTAVRAINKLKEHDYIEVKYINGGNVRLLRIKGGTQ